jgi:signal transduction histidine kinase/ActR/RegA family two-component response regulator
VRPIGVEPALRNAWRQLCEAFGRLDRQWGAGMAAALSVAPASRFGLVWVPITALLAAALLAASPLQERLSRSLHDLGLQAVARPADYKDVLVIDIDDASLRALRPRLGAWPYTLDTFALVIGYLRELGARQIAIDIVLSEHRDSEAALVRALADRADVALAGTALKRVTIADPPPDALSERLASPAIPGQEAVRWAGFTLPTEPLLQALARARGAHGPGGVGIISTPFDNDGVVRKLPLLHEANGRIYPAMPLATHLLAADRNQPLQRHGDALVLGTKRWPVDERACVTVLIPSNADAVPTLAFSTLIAAALGMSEGAGLREQIAGRTVFVGSSAFLSDEVTTLQRQLSGTMLLALTHAALQRGDVIDSSAPRLSLALLVVALAPSLCLWQRRRPALVQDAGAALLALIALLTVAMGALAMAKLQAGLLVPLTVLTVGFMLAAILQLHWVGLANQQLTVARAVAEAANREKTQFLANVSHEIRTPMNALLGVAELLQRTPLNAEQQRYVDVFQRSGRTLYELINDLLDLSTIEAGRLELKLRPFSLHRLLAEQRELFAPRAADRALQLEWQLAEDLPDAIVADRGRLAQVLTNLIGNAIKFTPSGTVSLVVSARDGRLHCVVRDTGIGIDPAQQARVFEPFTQADGSATRAYGGSGLGLAIARSLVQQMGGQLTLESRPGEGSSFGFDLPLALAPAEPVAVPGPVPADAAGAGEPMPFRVLLTEDNEVNVLLVRAMLEDSGCVLEVAGNGQEALAMFVARRYDLVLMDIQMPGLDGLATTREIRRIEAESARAPVAIVALTAHAYERDVQHSLEAGCNAHLTKPISRETLLSTINRFRPG